jgi:tetratricopeptide (TPR) repeat protein
LTDAAFPDRLTQLRAKWEADPTSRIFLQLAEEYRHLGRVKDGLAVLDRGLKEHPGYLSALVAKGRCHLELGEAEPARVVLERVVKQDATQMVANKLLVRAYLETGEPGKARERLDLYTLLNDSDPEIEELRRRIKSMDRPAPAEEKRQMDADPFSLEPVPVVRRPVAAADVFDFDPPPPVAAAPLAVPAEPAEPEPHPDDLLFPGLASRDSRRRYLEGLGAEGLFSFAPTETAAIPAITEMPETTETTETAPAPAPVEPVKDESAWLEEPAATAYAPPPVELEEPPLFADLAAPPGPVEEDLWGDETAPLTASPVERTPESVPESAPEPVAAEPAPAEEPIATATLGEIYLRQGYLAEAERIFHEVLQHEPENAAARAGLAQLGAAGEAARRRSDAPPLAAHQLLAGFQPSSGLAGGSGVTARKIFLLNSYLERLRQGRKGLDVS